MGMAFDDIQIATLDELGMVLATIGPDIECVAVSGVPTRGGRLGEVLRQVLAVCPASVQVLLDLRGPAGPDLVAAGAPALRGFQPVDCVQLWEVPCLLLVRSTAPEAVPDLAPWRTQLLERRGDETNGDVEHLAAQVQVGPLRDRIVELEREVAVLKDSLSSARTRLGATQKTEREARAAVARLHASRMARAVLWAAGAVRLVPGRAASTRARRLALFGLIGATVLVGVAIGVAAATGTGYVGGVLTVVVALVGAQLAYSWRVQGRLATRMDRTARRIQDGVTSDAGAARRHAKVERDLASQQSRLKEIEHDLAIIAASTVDIAQAVTSLRASPAPTKPVSEERQA